MVSALRFISIPHIAVQAAPAVLQRRLSLRQSLYLCLHILHAFLTLLYSRADLEVKWFFFSYLLVTTVQENNILKVSPCAAERGKFSVHSILPVASPSSCLTADDVEHMGIVCCRLLYMIGCGMKCRWPDD